MVIHGHKTLLVRCHLCGRLRIYDFNIFDICGNEVEYKCKCGETNVFIRTGNCKTYWIKVNCFACSHEHTYRYTLKDILERDNFIVCTYDTRVCFIGKEEKAKELIYGSKVNAESLLKNSGFDNCFENFKILLACLNKLDKLNGDGNINCDCGDSSVEIEVFSDRIELRCSNCNSVQMIYAETEEDLEVVLMKEKILMHKHNINCIDSIVEKNKNTKEK